MVVVVNLHLTRHVLTIKNGVQRKRSASYALQMIYQQVNVKLAKIALPSALIVMTVVSMHLSPEKILCLVWEQL
jgi:hypothetical protein